jgi:hypothetical protein
MSSHTLYVDVSGEGGSRINDFLMQYLTEKEPGPGSRAQRVRIAGDRSCSTQMEDVEVIALFREELLLLQGMLSDAGMSLPPVYRRHTRTGEYIPHLSGKGARYFLEDQKHKRK